MRTPADPSDPDVAVVLEAYAAYARGDAEAAVAAMDAAIEWTPPVEFPNGGRRVGPEAVAEYLAASRVGWKHLTSEPTAHRVGGEIVVVHRVQGILADGTAHGARLDRRLRRGLELGAYLVLPAVDSIDLDIAAGESFSLLGPSGCGKTTTLRLIAGFERPTGGSRAPPPAPERRAALI